MSSQSRRRTTMRPNNTVTVTKTCNSVMKFLAHFS
jgi:hypothetical protein